MIVTIAGVSSLVGAAWFVALRDAGYAKVAEALHDSDMELTAPPFSFVRWRRDSPYGEVDPNAVFLVHKGQFVVRIGFAADDMQSIEEIDINDPQQHSWITAKPLTRTFDVFTPEAGASVGDEGRYVRDSDGDGYPDQVIELRASRSVKYEIEWARVEKEELAED